MEEKGEKKDRLLYTSLARERGKKRTGETKSEKVVALRKKEKSTIQ